MDKPVAIGERARLHLLAGPAVAVKMSCNVSITFAGETESSDCADEDGEDGLKSLDLGLAGGAQFVIEMSDNLSIVVGAQYNLGLLDIIDPPPEEVDVGTAKNRALTLRAGISIG